LKWELGIVEAIIVIMSVGLSVDFVVHFGVGYIHTDSNDIERERRKIHERYSLNQSSDDAEVQTLPSRNHNQRERDFENEMMFVFLLTI